MMVLIFILWKHAVYNGNISSITWYKQLLDENRMLWYSILHIYQTRYVIRSHAMQEKHFLWQSFFEWNSHAISSLAF